MEKCTGLYWRTGQKKTVNTKTEDNDRNVDFPQIHPVDTQSRSDQHLRRRLEEALLLHALSASGTFVGLSNRSCGAREQKAT